MPADRRKEEALRLLGAGRRLGEIAREIGVDRRTLAAWSTEPAFVEAARRAFAAQAVELLPVALDRLKSLVDCEKETTALAAVRLVVRIAELAAASAADQDEVAARLARVIDDVLDDVLGGADGNIHAFAREVKRKEEGADFSGDKGAA